MSELLEKILFKDNMNAAYKRVYANKGAGGVDGVTAEKLGDYIKENWDSIRNQIRSREYKAQPVRNVEIPEPNGGERKLGIPTVMESRRYDTAGIQRNQPRNPVGEGFAAADCVIAVKE